MNRPIPGTRRITWKDGVFRVRRPQSGKQTVGVSLLDAPEPRRLHGIKPVRVRG
ncbi:MULTISPECIES: hypothetical protein [unclassified Streptomyces]|uniref:hypothetical protein n=1 Tax=unclassified Streptomyces TaxID=2593676 RepID=UPI0037122222